MVHHNIYMYNMYNAYDITIGKAQLNASAVLKIIN